MPKIKVVEQKEISEEEFRELCRVPENSPNYRIGQIITIHDGFGPVDMMITGIKSDIAKYDYRLTTRTETRDRVDVWYSEEYIDHNSL